MLPERKRSATSDEIAPTAASVSKAPAPHPTKIAKSRHVARAIHASYGSRTIGEIRGLPYEAQTILCVAVLEVDKNRDRALRAVESAAQEARDASLAGGASMQVANAAADTATQRARLQAQSGSQPLSVLALHGAYSSRLKRLHQDAAPMSTFLSLTENLLSSGLVAVSRQGRGSKRRRKKSVNLDRQTQLDIRASIRDVKIALCPEEGSRQAAARDAPKAGQRRFFQRLMKRGDAPGGSFYRAGIDQAPHQRVKP